MKAKVILGLQIKRDNSGAPKHVLFCIAKPLRRSQVACQYGIPVKRQEHAAAKGEEPVLSKLGHRTVRNRRREFATYFAFRKV